MAISFLLVKEETNDQFPYYFVNKVFTSVKMKYLKVENYLYVLAVSAVSLIFSCT